MALCREVSGASSRCRLFVKGRKFHTSEQTRSATDGVRQAKLVWVWRSDRKSVAFAQHIEHIDGGLRVLKKHELHVTWVDMRQINFFGT